MINVIFLGTPKIAESSLEYLIKSPEINVLAVVTQPDKPVGRGHKIAKSPIKILAEEHDIKIFQPISIRKEPEIIDKLKSLSPDFFITVAFGQILSKEILDIPKYGTINLHASLLPKYRGANPIQRAIVNGEKVTGVTTMLTSIGVDEGDMLLKQEIEITENMNSLDLAIRISEIGPELLLKSMRGLVSKEITPEIQNNEAATFAPKFVKEDGLIDWRKTQTEIHNQVRGLYGWPGAYTYFEGVRVKIFETKLTTQKSIKKPSETVLIEKRGITIATGDFDIVVEILQAENKKQMEAFQWANGVNLKIGESWGGK